MKKARKTSTATLFAASVAIVLPAVFGLSCAGAAEESIKIGVMADMSGPLSSYYGPGSLEAVKLAVADFGGKVLGRPIEVLSADHQNKPDVGVSILRQWYDSGVVAAVDAANAAVSLAATDVARDKNKVVVLVGSGSALLKNKNCNPNTVTWGNDIYFMAHALTRSTKSWFFLVSDYAFGHMLEAEVTSALNNSGGTIRGSVRHPFNSPDLSAYLLRARASKAEVIGLLNAVSDLQNSIKQAQEFNITATQRIVAPAFTELDAKAIGLVGSKGTESSAIFYWARTPETRAFSERFAQRFGKPPTPGQAADYSGTLHLLRAIAASSSTDGATIVAKMKELPVNDVFANNAFLRDDGRLIMDVYLVRTKDPGAPVQKAPYSEYDVFDVVGTIPGPDAFEPLDVSECPLVKPTSRRK